MPVPPYPRGIFTTPPDSSFRRRSGERSVDPPPALPLRFWRQSESVSCLRGPRAFGLAPPPLFCGGWGGGRALRWEPVMEKTKLLCSVVQSSPFSGSCWSVVIAFFSKSRIFQLGGVSRSTLTGLSAALPLSVSLSSGILSRSASSTMSLRSLSRGHASLLCPLVRPWSRRGVRPALPLSRSPFMRPESPGESARILGRVVGDFGDFRGSTSLYALYLGLIVILSSRRAFLRGGGVSPLPVPVLPGCRAPCPALSSGLLDLLAAGNLGIGKADSRIDSNGRRT